jgi:hypothetical protein
MARLPEQLGSVRLVRQIGSGRNCQVWEGREGVEERAVAVKVVAPQRACSTNGAWVAPSITKPSFASTALRSTKGSRTS